MFCHCAHVSIMMLAISWNSNWAAGMAESSLSCLKWKFIYVGNWCFIAMVTMSCINVTQRQLRAAHEHWRTWGSVNVNLVDQVVCLVFILKRTKCTQWASTTQYYFTTMWVKCVYSLWKLVFILSENVLLWQNITFGWCCYSLRNILGLKMYIESMKES